MPEAETNDIAAGVGILIMGIGVLVFTIAALVQFHSGRSNFIMRWLDRQ